jgi:hypothetical protein
MPSSLHSESTHTPELLKSFTLRTELITSRPISSKTRTFHTAPSADVPVVSWPASSCASTSVMGALRFRMRLMLASEAHVSELRILRVDICYLSACPAV